MDMRFQILSFLRTINTKPLKVRGDSFLSKLNIGILLSSAILFLMTSIYSFWNAQDVDGLLFFVPAIYSFAGALLGRHISRSDALSAIFCTVLAFFSISTIIWSSHGIITILWILFLPIANICICGIKFGLFINGVLAIYNIIFFYTPLWQTAPAEYPSEIRYVFPILYGIVCAISFVYGYVQHKQILNKQNNEKTLEKAVKTEHHQLIAMTTQTILSISNAVDARDAYTKRHSSRVADYSVLLAKALGWDSRRLEQLYNIALLHDIGKIGISDSILNKHTSLSPEEREIIKQHTVIGGEILKDLTLLPNASIGAVSHHERFDGTGYPYGLKGSQIPLEARIIGIADAFDAMNSSRVYRARISSGKIMEELRAGSGSQFDPKLLDTFLPIAEHILQKDDI